MSSSSNRIAIPLTLSVALVTTAVAWYGTRETPAPTAASDVATPQAALVQGSVRSITLPKLEVELPPGPHQREFIVACTTCHSAQLVLNQPRFEKAKWSAIVQKMVKVLGAPLPAEAEPAVVEYLVAIRGK